MHLWPPIRRACMSNNAAAASANTLLAACEVFDGAVRKLQ